MEVSQAGQADEVMLWIHECWEVVSRADSPEKRVRESRSQAGSWEAEGLASLLPFSTFALSLTLSGL